jgi:hypothetical protein
MRYFLMLSITINSLYYWRCFHHVAQGYSSLALAHLRACEKGGLRLEKAIVIVL